MKWNDDMYRTNEAAQTTEAVQGSWFLTHHHRRHARHSEGVTFKVMPCTGPKAQSTRVVTGRQAYSSLVVAPNLVMISEQGRWNKSTTRVSTTRVR